MGRRKSASSSDGSVAYMRGTIGLVASDIASVLRRPNESLRVFRNSDLRRHFDPRVAAWQAQIDEAYSGKKWHKTIELIRAVFRISGAMDTPENRTKLIYCHAHLGQYNGVDSRLAASLKRHPGDSELLKAQAERFMMLGQYSNALEYWQRFAESSSEKNEPAGTARGFPARGVVFDWYEAAWVTIAEKWAGMWAEARLEPTVCVYRRTIQTLASVGELSHASDLSLVALTAHPDEKELSVQACETVLRNSTGMGATDFVKVLKSGGSSSVADRIRKAVDKAATVETDLRALGALGRDELRILTVYRNTGADFSIRSGNFWDERRIHEEALRLAKRDGWVEQTSSTDLLSPKAWSEAQKFSTDRASVVGVNTKALARAVFHYFKQELTQKIPVDRIADEIAATVGNEPVYLDLGALKIPYMVSYPTARMQTLYFYAALRKRGCNAYLVRFPRRPAAEGRARFRRAQAQPTPMPTILLVPQPAQLKPPSRALKVAEGNPAAVVVPAGIRSVKQVISRVDGALVVNSGSAVKGYAYDRTSAQNWDYDVNLSFHSNEKGLLPSFKLSTTLKRAWRDEGAKISGSVAMPFDGERVEAFLSMGYWKTDDWHEWLERAIIPYFRDFVKRTRKTLQEHAIMDAHIGDYLYAEPALVAQKVKDRGGRVHVWPHSTNPVHIDFHDPAHLTTVNAVTKSGADTWKKALPNVNVVHDSRLMLTPSTELVPHVPGEPTSIVLIGGRPVMRNLPILDIAAHEDLYRRMFQRMAPLVDAGMLKVYFKPRGRTGEHEGWLERLVGRAADWERVLDHPLRMNVVNPVFVSLSVGSSALLEGTMRGIPGFIVREHFARDYLATEEGIFDTITVDEAVGRLRMFSRPGYWSDARTSQIKNLARDLASGDGSV